MTKLIARKVAYYSEGDERMFFEFLKGNSAVVSFQGVQDSVEIEVEDTKLTFESFMSIYALFKRYDVETRQLSKMDTSHDSMLSKTLRGRDMIWYHDIFGA